MGENLGFKHGMIYLALFGFLLAATVYTVYVAVTISDLAIKVFAVIEAGMAIIALWLGITKMRTNSP